MPIDANPSDAATAAPAAIFAMRRRWQHWKPRSWVSSWTPPRLFP